ncbi:hypothetical protein GCM10009534_35260 [Kribbella sandramycini]
MLEHMFYSWVMGSRSRIYTPPIEPDPRQRLCWVYVRVDDRDRWRPGVILDWRPANGGGKAALVAHVRDPHTFGFALEWFATTRIWIVTSQPPSQARQTAAHSRSAGGTRH